MADFVFKVPKLPEDMAFHKRTGNNLIRSKSDTKTWDLRGECRKPSQTSHFDRCNRMGNHFQLQPLREGVQEDLAQPCTSQHRKELLTSSNKFGVFHHTFDRFDHCSFKGNSFSESHSNFMNATVGENYSVFNSVNLPRMAHSGVGDRVVGNGSNSSSLHNNNHSSIMSSCIKNSFHKKTDLCRGVTSGNFFQQCWYRGEDNMIEPSHSSLSMRKSVFSIDGFTKSSAVQRDINTSERTSHFNCGLNAFGCLTRTSSIQRDSHFSLNTSQSVSDNQSFMKSVFQMSMVSMKEEIMNKLENLGHSLLRNAPEMEGSFARTAKDIKSILEKSICINPVLSTTGLPPLSYTSGVIGCPQQNTLHSETNKQQCEIFKKPSSILQNVLCKKNENPKCEFIKSFSIKRKEKNVNYEDVSFENSKILDDMKEVNLKNWYPVIQNNGLAFIGLNDENVEMETGTIKKRINNRRVMLENGTYCNLIGNPSTGKKFPKAISMKIKNGLNLKWKALIAIMGKFQKSMQKENCEIMERDISTTTEFETSLNSTVMTRRTAKFLKLSNVDNPKLQRKDNFKSPKAEKLIVESTDDWYKKHKSGGTQNKVENIGRKRSRSSVEKRPVKIQKTDTAKGVYIEKPVVMDEQTDRVLSTTRSGRVVKRPKDILIGSSFPESDTLKKSKGEEIKRKKRKENHPAKSAKVKNQEEKPDTRVKNEPADMLESLVAAKTKRKTTKKVMPKSVSSGKKHTDRYDNPWGNDIDGLDDICLPDISIHHEEVTADPKKLKFLTMETPPLKNIRSNLTFLENYTPVQSPDWQVSRHTRSAVKKFEKLRAQAFKTKIPMENGAKRGKKSKNPLRNNKDVETFVNWISERQVRSPKQCSNLINYLMPKSNKEEYEEDSGDEMKDEEAI